MKQTREAFDHLIADLLGWLEVILPLCGFLGVVALIKWALT